MEFLRTSCKHNFVIVVVVMPLLACVASVSSRGSSRKLGQEQKNMNDGGGGEELQFLQLPAICSIREQSNFTNLVIQG